MLIFAEIALVSTKMPDADFWLVRVHDKNTVGKPTREYNPEHIGIQIIETNALDPHFAFYLFEYLWQRGYWRRVATGGTRRQHIKVSDVQALRLAPQLPSWDDLGGARVRTSEVSGKAKPVAQSVLVAKEIAPRKASAAKIVKELGKGYKTSKADETELFWRFRQHPPEKFRKGTWMTWTLGFPEGVKVVAATPKRGSKVA